MNIVSIKYKAAKDYLDENPLIRDLLSSAISEIIQNKSNRFTEEQAFNKYNLLRENGILISDDNISFYQINLKSSLACASLLDYAENSSKKPFPDSPYDAIVFIDDFLQEIRKPKINHHWYTMEFRRAFKKFILLEFEDFFLDNFDKLLKIYNEDYELDSPDHKLQFHLDKAIPHFKLTSSQFITLANNLLLNKKHQYKGHEIIREVSLQSHKRVKELFEIVSKEKEQSPFLSTIIIGLSHFDFTKSFEESVKLLNSPKTEFLGISCLCRLNFNNENQLTRAFQRLKSHKSENLAYLKELAIANRNFIANEYATDELKIEGIKNIGELIEHKDNEVVNQAVYWLSSIKGFEDEKMSYLYSLMNRGIQVDFWNYFKDFSNPTYLFDFVKEVYANLGLKANIHPFEQAFDTFYREKSEDFELGLAELLSNDYGVIRKAGIDLLISKHFGSYNVNLLNLNEKRQLIVIDTLLEIPLQIEKTLPIVLQLRSSKFQKVQEALIAKCTQLVFAYEELIIEILSSCLTKESDTDLLLLNKVKIVWEDYEKNLAQKRELIELNPFINQRQLVNLYYRSEQEHQIEQMEHAQKNSSMMRFGIAKNISVLRGCAFKMEGKDGRISKLGKVETKMYMDKRYFINPSAYEFAYQNHILNKNYIKEEEE